MSRNFVQACILLQIYFYRIDLFFSQTAFASSEALMNHDW
jgi:hypothetical protein